MRDEIYMFSKYARGAETEEPKECKGLYFRGIVNDYMTEDRIVFKTELRLLKKKSCPGCSSCDHLMESLRDCWDVAEIIQPKGGIQQGEVYTIKICNEHRDYESGYIDDWDYAIIPVKEAG